MAQTATATKKKIASKKSASVKKARRKKKPEQQEDQKHKYVATGLNQKKAVEALMEQAIGLQINQRMLGNTRKGDKTKIKTDAELGLIEIKKKIFDCPEYKAIKDAFRSVRYFIESYCLPSYSKRGVYIVKKITLPTVVDRLKELAQFIEVKVVAFEEVYEDVVEEHLSRLNSQGRRSDYPAKEALRSHFELSWHTMRFDPDPALREISEGIYKEEQTRVTNWLGTVGQEVASVMRGKAAELLDHAIERMQDNTDGRRKIIKDAPFDNLKDFVQMFNLRDAAGDDVLAAKVRKIEKIMKSVDTDKIRDDDSFRAAIRNKMETVRAEMDTMIVKVPIRKFQDFSDED